MSAYAPQNADAAKQGWSRMRKVERNELVDYMTYNDIRDAFRGEALAAKAPRRIHVGDHLTFLFENTLTVRYQIQEMMRVEQLVREADVLRELDTYNELLGTVGELGCTLLIEFEDEAERADRLVALKDLNAHLFLEVQGGDRVAPTFDDRQMGDDRLSSVQYLKFNAAGRAPVALLSTHPEYDVRCELSVEQRDALGADLLP